MELGDSGKSFQESLTANGQDSRFVLSHAPVDASSVSVFLDAVDITDNDPGEGVQVEESTGTLIFDFVPAAGALIIVVGTSYRFLTDDELTTICNESLLMHTKDRVDIYGRRISLENLPDLEMSVLATLCAKNALYVLATDASFDIDIQAPDGMSVPRSERYRQLMDMIHVLDDRYRENCSLLGVGMHGIQVFTLRRVSKRTNRYVPVYMPQEIDDRARPERAEIPASTYGGVVRDDGVPSLDLVIGQGKTFSRTLDDVTPDPSAVLRAQVRGYPGSPVVIAEFDVDFDVDDKVTISLEASATRLLPRNAVWDIVQSVASTPEPIVTALKRGRIYSPREITTGDGLPSWPIVTSASTTGSYFSTPQNQRLPSRYPLTIVQGTDFEQSFDWVEDGHLIDLAGWSLRAQMRPGPADEYPGDPTATFSVTVEDGTIYLRLTDTQTQAIPKGKYRYDLEGTDPQNKDWSIIAGSVVVEDEVTRG